MDKDPMHLGTDADQKYTAQAQALSDYPRSRQRAEYSARLIS
jgi:hypothetical protein